jgi:hypothetical protein
MKKNMIRLTLGLAAICVVVMGLESQADARLFGGRGHRCGGGRMFGHRHHCHHQVSCCEQTCEEEPVCETECAAPVEECCPSDCCDSGCGRRHHRRHRHRGCGGCGGCDSGCGGCDSGCGSGYNGGVIVEEGVEPANGRENGRRQNGAPAPAAPEAPAEPAQPAAPAEAPSA